MAFEFIRSMCALSFDKNTYDFAVTDSASFAFLKNRFYIRFDTLLVNGSKEILEQKIRDRAYGETFMLTLSDADENPVDMACRIAPTSDPDVIQIQMHELSTLYDICLDSSAAALGNELIAAQYDNVFYKYVRRRDKITCYRYEDAKKKILYTIRLDELEERMADALTNESHEEFLKFISDLRNGVRCFSDTVTRRSDNTELNLTGKAIYNGPVHFETVGRMGSAGISDRELAMLDPLTGAYLRGVITDYARERINERHEKTAVAIIDLDDFKNVNDNFGHAKGDDVLRRTAAIIIKCTAGLGKVGRIGGDEFLVVYDNFEDIAQIRFTLMGMRSLMVGEFPEKREGFRVTLSIGASVYPNDYDGTFEEMFRLADAFLYRAKDKGKDRYIVYNEEKHGPSAEILKHGFKKSGLVKSELACQLANAVICGERLETEQILDSISRYFNVDRVVLYNKTDRYIASQVGQKRISMEQVRKTIGYIYEDALTRLYNNGVMVLNSTDHFRDRDIVVYNMLKEQSVYSLMHFEVNAESGKRFILSCEAVNSRITWNHADLHYYRMIARVLEKIL